MGGAFVGEPSVSIAPELGTIGAEIAKLLPMLGSDHDGEVIAVVRALGRKLNAGGKDWHWLAEQVLRLESTTREARKPSAAWHESTPRTPPASRKERHAVKPIWTTIDRPQQLAWLVLLDGQPWLTAVEAELVAAIRPQIEQGQSLHLPPRQKRMLTALVRSAREKGLCI